MLRKLGGLMVALTALALAYPGVAWAAETAAKACGCCCPSCCG